MGRVSFRFLPSPGLAGDCDTLFRLIECPSKVGDETFDQRVEDEGVGWRMVEVAGENAIDLGRAEADGLIMDAFDVLEDQGIA